jgi:hypothetical protein
MVSDAPSFFSLLLIPAFFPRDFIEEATRLETFINFTFFYFCLYHTTTNGGGCATRLSKMTNEKNNNILQLFSCATSESVLVILDASGLNF